MKVLEAIDLTVSDVAATVDHSAKMWADRTPPPLDALVLRVGAINAEAVRQYGRVAVTTLDAVNGVATVAWTGVSELAEATAEATGASVKTVKNTGRQAAGDVRRTAKRLESRAAKAADEVERNFSVVGDEAARVGERVERETEEAAEDVVRAADVATAETAERGARTPGRAYENWSKDELYERAQEIDLEGRSHMTKSELIRALRSA